MTHFKTHSVSLVSLVQSWHVRPFFASTESQESKSEIAVRNKTWQCALWPILRTKFLLWCLWWNLRVWYFFSHLEIWPYKTLNYFKNWFCILEFVGGFWRTINSLHNLINQEKTIAKVDWHSKVLSHDLTHSFGRDSNPFLMETPCDLCASCSGGHGGVWRTINSLYIKEI